MTVTPEEREQILDALARGEVRLQGGPSSAQGWSIAVTADGTWLRSDFSDPEREVVVCDRAAAREALETFGSKIVVRLPS